MGSYYNIHEGNLHPGDVAKSSDINIIQRNIQDAIKNAIKDLTEGQSWILGTNDQSDKNSFILTPESKRAGRYIDQINLAEGNDADLVSIRETSYRQPIKLSRSSIYSIIVKMQNKSEVSVPVNFELRDENGYLIPNMKTVLNLPKYTDTPTEFEIIFDLDYYPTAHGFSPEELMQDDNRYLNINTKEASFENGIDFGDSENLNSSSAGASIIYLHIEALNKNRQRAFDVNTQQDDGYQWNDVDPTFGIVINKNSTYGQLLEENNGSDFVKSSKPGDLYFKEIYANAPTYKCEIGQAIIDGEKVMLADTHVSIGGASSAGNVISYVYMDSRGHLKAQNSDPFLGNEPATPNIITEPHLHIADIITYQNDVNEPVIQQSDETQITRPRSHHERIRRLENKLLYTQDIAIPTRLKYTLTGEDWIDPYPNVDMVSKSYNGYVAQSIDALNESGYVTTLDMNGNFIVKASDAKSFSIPVTLKTDTSGKISTEKNETKIIKEAQTDTFLNELTKDDIKRAQTFAEIKNMRNDIEAGKLTLEITNNNIIVATSEEEAKRTEFNPWDDAAENRPANADVTPIERSYTVVSGKNGANDWESEFPAMTFFTDTGYKLKKLQVPIYKFKNCKGIKFIIWKRQGPNDKKNTVWLEKKIYTSKEFSLENAKVKDDYQYMEDGFLIDFEEAGLELEKGQYVIVCFPTVESGSGSVYVETYKPADSKDFCIRYYGAANGSHFLLKDRYHEIWYNSAKAQIEEITYSESGELTSGIVSWDNIEPIKSVKPMANLTIPESTTAKIYVDVGGGWKEVENDKDNDVIGSGGGDSFRWKIEFKGNSKDTPVLQYDEEKKYAISFQITRAEPKTSNLSAYRTLNNNLCITSKVLDANDILRDYIGDMNFALSDNKFSNYEFLRIWGTDSDDESLLIDISASDRIEPVKNSDGTDVVVEGQKLYYPVFSFHYVDLKLDDIPNTSVDYSNYDPTLENDEHNLRMKLDTENSYNDDDIDIIKYDNFVLTNDSYAIDESEEGLGIDLKKIIPSEENQIIAKAQFINPLDLSKYSGLKMKLTLNGTKNGTLSGLALYISSQYEQEAPTNKKSEDILNALPDGLPDLNHSQEDIIALYANQTVVDTVDYNGTAVKVYYKSVWNSIEQKWEWQQLHDIKSYNIYEIINRKLNADVLKITNEDGKEVQYCEIEIDPNSVNLQFAKEIGIILLQDEGQYDATNINSIYISDFKAIKNDYYSVFNAAEENVFTKVRSTSPVVCQKHGSLTIESGKYPKTVPPTSSINIMLNRSATEGEDLCYFDLTSKSTKGFKHIGIQLASDCLITKNMLELHLRKINEYGQEITIEKIKLPTINYVYYSTTSNDQINLCQIIKKIKTDERFDKIVLVSTNRFRNYGDKLKTLNDANDLGTVIKLFIGKIELYRANSFPLLYPYMRMKFYLDEADEVARDQIGVRKIGAVIQYR